MDKRRLLLITVFSFATAYALHVSARHLRLSAAIDAKITAPVSSVAPAYRSLRPNYPYSVVPGGVYSPAELQSAIHHDHLVDQHYSDFNLKSAYLVTLKEDRLQYVSYRLKNHIYWTRNKLRIPKGEVLLTDGYNFARTRCGNRLSSQSHAEISPEQPAQRVLSLPQFTPDLLKKGEVTLAPPPEVELTPGAPELLFDLPRIAPYTPPMDFSAGLPVQSQIPVLQSYPPTVGIIASGTPPVFLPGSPKSPSTPVMALPTPRLPSIPIPILPTVPITPETPVPPVNTVPEPASLSLFAASVCGLLWLLARVMRSDVRSRD